MPLLPLLLGPGLWLWLLWLGLWLLWLELLQRS
jgi:hypothetical protein